MCLLSAGGLLNLLTTGDSGNGEIPVFVIRRSDDDCPTCGGDQLLYDDDQALIEFRSRYEATKFALEELAGVTIERLNPKRGNTHFE